MLPGTVRDVDDLLVTAPRVVTPEGVLAPGWVTVTGERVTGTGTGAPPSAAATRHLAGTVVPGFVDLHVHGGGGASFGDVGTDPEAVPRVVAAHRRGGTTTTLASLVSAPPAVLARQVAALAELAADGVVDGIHLEGPWLSPARAGAHDPAALRPPDPTELDALLRAGRGHIRVVTLAPELDGALDGAVAAVRRLADAGVVVAIGHTEADAATARRAVDAGARLGTHLFNAMPPMHHRDPGPVGALLADPRCVVELVADGVHLHPDVLAVAARAAGPGRWALVTDAVAAAGLPPGAATFALGVVQVAVQEGVARTVASGALAGSTLTLDAALRTATGRAGLPVADAVAATTSVPAGVLGLADRGVLRTGARADLVGLGDDGDVLAVLRAGRWVPRPDSR